MMMPASDLRRSSAMALQRVNKAMGASVTSSGSLSALDGQYVARSHVRR